jgi:hypothetical protein
MITSKKILENPQKTTLFALKSSKILWILQIVIFLTTSQNSIAQIDFSKIPASQNFNNNGIPLIVKNIQYTQYDKELDCTWKTSHAQIDGMMDVKNQNFLNDWLSGLSYFGNCEGDKECYDFLSFHYYYKVTRVSLIRNDLLAFYLQEGNCKKSNDSCMENQDWEIYDLKTKHFLQEGDILRQDAVSQKAFFALIENKVKRLKYHLVNDWKAYTRQIGLDGNEVVIYLNNDILNNNRGITLRFKPSEIYKLLEPCIEKRLYFKDCNDSNFQKITLQQQGLHN